MKIREIKGSVLIYSIIMLTVILATSLGLAGIFIPKIRIVSSVVNSVGALSAADSAVEVCLYEARQQVLPTPLASPLLTNTATYRIASLSSPEVDVTGDCRPLGTDRFQFRATGTYHGVNRALEVSQ